MTTFADPRARMRDALRVVLREDPPAWDDASLLRFRNRLLDETGSDARPLAELLLEAVRRGWREQLPTSAVDPARWDAMVAPFVMRWSAERFVQPEMARWAAETWGYSLGVIGVEQLRIAPPVRPTPIAVARAATLPSATGASGATAAANVMANTGANAAKRTPRSSGALPVPATTSTRVAPRARQVPTPSRRVVPRSNSVNTLPYARSNQPSTSIPQLNPKLVRGLAGLAAAAYVFFIGTMAYTINKNRKAEAAAAVASAASPAPSKQAADSVVGTTTIVPGQNIAAPAPSTTRAPVAMPAYDSARMLFVEPVRRASGASLPVAATSLTPSRTDPVSFDKLELTDGTRLSGRVDVIRSGTVIFRDAQTGLRNEIPKDDIEQITTEFGTVVRFHAAGTSSGARGKQTRTDNAPSTPVLPNSASSPNRKADAAAGSLRSAGSTVRGRGFGGRYAVRYGAAQANGSQECVSVWTRSPDAVDYATVSHAPDADTLTIAFDGGENYPSNVDRAGSFASTPRIMPEQAKTSTALVTRLSGRFPGDGSLTMTVSIVFYRRMRAGPDLACTVYINASGKKIQTP